MLAEGRGPGSLSGAPWKLPNTSKDVKKPHLPDRRRSPRKSSGQRRCFLGLETRPELFWEDWVIGKEYTKRLVLKNVGDKLQKLHVRAPESKFFSISNPDLVALSPGTSFSFLVTFTPHQKCEYEDSVCFQAKEGSFQVSLRAVPPSPTLKVPESVMLPLCAVQHSTKASFPLQNVSKVQTSFKLDCAAPFQLSPEQDVLKPGQECLITVDFQPQEAKVYQQQAHCSFGEDGDKTDGCCSVLLQGIAKYPHIQLRHPDTNKNNNHDDPELDFGSVAVGQSLSKQFEIFNPSPVNVCFSLSRLPGGPTVFGSDFSWEVNSDKIAPGGSLQVLFTYSPAVVDKVSVEYFCLNYRGALRETQIKLTGTCLGPKMSLSSCVVNFGCVVEGGLAAQTVELLNSSPVEAIYQWDIDCCNSIFSVSPASGTLLPHGVIKVKVVYRPTHAMAHYRRVACLLLHRGPLFLDLIGACCSELRQPVKLQPERSVVHKKQWCCTQNSPDSTSDFQLNQQGAPLLTEEEESSATIIPPTSVERMDPLSSFAHPLLSIEPIELLFNHKTTSLSTSSTSSQCLSITSHAKGKLRLMWTVVQDSPFCVAPSSFELAPLKSTTVRVTYEPKQINALHGGELECFAYYKDAPGTGKQLPGWPWCATVRVIGHSFQPGQEHFTPHCILKPHEVVFFRPLSVMSYRNVLLQNNGDQPLTFCSSHTPNDVLPESVQMLPACGLIQPRKHQIVTVGVVPEVDSHVQRFSLALQLNAATFTKELTVVSVFEKPKVSLESGGRLYFNPTAVGSKTQRTHSIRNLSCMPIKFQWSIPVAEQKLIFVEPDAGKLHPNESSVQIWSFSPLAETTYTFTPTVGFQSDDSEKLQLTLEVIGMGSLGSIKAVKEVLDVGEILVGSSRSVEIPLVNKSPCSVSFRISVQRMLKEDLFDSEDHSALVLDSEMGTIASHSTVQIRPTVRVCTPARHLWSISYQMWNASGFDLSPSRKLCEVRAKGVFPTLQVIDSCSGGSVARLSKQYLCKLFSLDNLNEQLLSTPSPEELTFKTPTKHSLHNSPSIFTKVMLDFNFAAAPLHSNPSDFMLMFLNPGSIPVDWTFLFPEDQKMELDDWAVTGEFSSTELHQMKVQDNQLFRVFPRSGSLLPGQKRVVQFSYSHDFIGTNRLPVVFKLSFGREILLNFQGVTVERNEPYLHLASNNHVFTSVDMCDSSPPRQMYELYNGGAVAAHYEVDMAVLSQLQRENYDHPVLSCLSPQGHVLPGNKATLEWIFSPLEAKMYQMDVPIHIPGSDSIIIHFEGRGTGASSMSTDNLTEYKDIKAPKHSVQTEPFPGQEVVLSQDRVSFGDVPVCTKSSRIFFLTSLSNTETVYYVWEIPTQDNKQVVQIHPGRGCLCPGECAICVLTFLSDSPTVYQLDLICQVTNKAAFVNYHKALRRWEAERKRQQEEFTITDKDASNSQRILVDEITLAPPARKGAPLRKYKTLPPISTGAPDSNLYGKQTRAERRLQREAAKVWRRPQPPRPALLHLSVTAHSHDLRDYLAHFPGQRDKHGRYFELSRTQHTRTNSSSASVPVEMFPPRHGAMREILVDILARVCKHLLDDAAFAESLMASASRRPVHQPHAPASSPSVLSLSTLHPVRLNETVEKEEAASSLETVPQSQTTPGSKHVPAHVVECVLLKTLQNIMMEAVTGEFILTAHPLPPVSVRSGQILAEEDQ